MTKNLINMTEMDTKLQSLIQLAPTIQKCFYTDVLIAISNLDTVIYQLDPKGQHNPDSTGQKLTPQDPMYNAIHTKKDFQIKVPKELYGYAMRISVVPIFNDNRQVIGSITISRSNDNQSSLLDVSGAFASTSKELYHSADELSTSANTLASFMNDVQEAQQNLSGQVEDSTKILDMINNVAKNTRILGFNAGIEAARSGEHGKGFAVVAKEITKLADQSSDSVIEIRQLLHSMKEKVHEVTRTVNETIHLADTQVHTTENIAHAIEQLTIVSEKIDVLARKL